MPIIDGSGHNLEHTFIPYNGKIADITEADTNKHTLDLAAALSETRKIVAVQLFASRASGSGVLRVYPNEGTSELSLLDDAVQEGHNIVIADGTNRLQYLQSTANDDWNLYCLSYVVEA